MPLIQRILFSTFILLFSLNLFAQSSPFHYKNLVFEGAGIRGIAYVGVIDELEKSNVLKGIENYAGTSAGAVVALALALNYHSYEIKDFMLSTSFHKFNDGGFSVFGGLNRLNSRYGWYKTRSFEKWLEDIIRMKTGNESITFEELFKKTRKGLFVTGTCLNKQKLVVFSHLTYPKMKVKDAVRISMSIPLYFEAVSIDSIGNVFSKPKKQQQLDVMVDGGIIGNFPIFIFDSTYVDSVGNAHRIPNYQTLGIRVDSDEQIAIDRNGGSGNKLANYPIKNIQNYFEAFYLLTIESLNRQYLIAEDWHRTISISSADIDPRIKKQSMEEKQVLVNAGVFAAKHFLSHPLPYYSLLDSDSTSCIPNQTDPTYYIQETYTWYHQKAVNTQLNIFKSKGFHAPVKFIETYLYNNNALHYEASNQEITFKLGIKKDTLFLGNLIKLTYFIDSIWEHKESGIQKYFVHSLDPEGVSNISKIEITPLESIKGVYMLIMSDYFGNSNIIYLIKPESIVQFPLVYKFTPNCKGNEFPIKKWIEQ